MISVSQAFNEEEDRYLLCMSQKLGYGNWEDLKAELRSAWQVAPSQAVLHCLILYWQFRFDWFIKSRTPAELGRRVESLIRMIEKEKDEQSATKKKASSGAKRKAEDVQGGGKKAKK